MSWFRAGVTVERKAKKLLLSAHALHSTFMVYCRDGAVLSLAPLLCSTTLDEKQMVSKRFFFFSRFRLNTFVDFMNLILGRENVTPGRKVDV